MSDANGTATRVLAANAAPKGAFTPGCAHLENAQNCVQSGSNASPSPTPRRPRCVRCGDHLVPLPSLAEQAARLAGRAEATRSALCAMRLTVPAMVPAGLADLAEGLPRLSRALACHAGTCPEDAR